MKFFAWTRGRVLEHPSFHFSSFLPTSSSIFVEVFSQPSLSITLGTDLDGCFIWHSGQVLHSCPVSFESPTSVPLMLMKEKLAGQSQNQGILQEFGALRLWTDVMAEKVGEGR